MSITIYGSGSTANTPVLKHKKANKNSVKIPLEIPQQHFADLGSVFLKLDRFENSQKLIFKGKVTIVVKAGNGTFINLAGATLEAVKGLMVRAYKIQNGGLIGSDEALKLKTKHLDNTHGEIAAKQDVKLISDDVKTRKGLISSEKGSIIWESSSNGLFDNCEGELIAACEFKNIERGHKTHPHYTGRVLINNKGIITAQQSLLSLKLDKIDNRNGLLQGNSSDIHVNSFLNHSGKLFIVKNAKVFVTDLFDNTSGMIDVGGALNAENGNWNNSGGHLRANFGLKAFLHTFDNTKGNILSPNGNIDLKTTLWLSTKGQIRAADDIMLISLEGVVWGQEGSLITSKKVIIDSKQQYVDISKADIQAGELHVSAYQQLHLPLATIDTDGKVSFKTQQGWIDAQSTTLTSTADVIFDAKQGTLYLDDNKTNVKSLDLNVSGALVENSELQIKDSLTFVGESFKSFNTSYTLVNGNFVLNGIRSVNLEQGKVQAQRGIIQETSDDWVYEKKHDNKAKEIHRTAIDITLTQVEDVAIKVVVISNQLMLDHYHADGTQSLSLNTENKSIINNFHANAPDINIKASALMLTRANALFDKMKVDAINAHIHNLEATGKAFSATTGDFLAIHNSDFKARRIVLDTDKTSFTENTVDTDTFISTSANSQNFAGNIFENGDFTLESELGDASLQNNVFRNLNDVRLTAREGTTSIESTAATVDTFTVETKALEIANSEVRSEILNTFKPISHAYISKSLIISNGETDLETKSALIQESTIASDKTIITLAENGTFLNSQVAGNDVKITGNLSQIVGSTIKANTAEVTGAFYFDESAIEAGAGFNTKGSDALFNNSSIKAKNVTMNQGVLSFIGSESTSETLIQDAIEINSFNTNALSEFIERRADNIMHTGGVDKAFSVIEETTKNGVELNHLSLANNLIKSSENLQIHNSVAKTANVEYSGKNIAVSESEIEGRSLTGAKEKLLISDSDFTGPQVDLKSDGDISGDTLRVKSVNTTIKAVKTAYLQSSEFTSAESTNLTADHLFVPDNKIKSAGSATLSGRLVNAMGLEVLSDVAKIVATDAVNIPSSTLKTRILKVDGQTVDRMHGKVESESFEEHGKSGINAKYSSTNVNTLTQKSKGTINLEGSSTHASGNIYREASEIIHKEATSVARGHHTVANDIDNSGGTLYHGGGKSTMKVCNFIDDSKSKVLGLGVLDIESKNKFVQNGNVSIDGSYKVVAPSIVTRGVTMATIADFQATSSDLTFYGPLTADIGIFNAPLKTTNYAQMKFNKKGLFSTGSLDNSIGNIDSKHGWVHVHQSGDYQSPKNVQAKDLLLTANTSIYNLPENTYGNLTAISFNGVVAPSNPVNVNGDLTLKGNDITLKEETKAKGRGTFLSPGTFMVDEVEASFGNGIVVEAKTFSNFGRIQAVGDSSIICDHYNLGKPLEEQKPKRQKIFSLFNKPHVKQSSSYKYYPALLEIDGNLHLKAKVNGKNNAGTMRIHKNMELITPLFINENFEKLEVEKKEVGSYHNTTLGIKHGKRKYVYKTLTHRIPIETGNILVGGTLNTSIITLANKGNICAEKITGVIKYLKNGYEDNTGILPENFEKQPAHFFEGVNFQPGSEIRSIKGTFLVNDDTFNTGFIKSDEGAVVIETKNLFNKKRTEEGTEGVVVKKPWGVTAANRVTIREGQPGGEILGNKFTFIETFNGVNFGGEIGSLGNVVINATGDFTQKPLQLQEANHRIKSKTAHTRRNYVAAEVKSGEDVSLNADGTFLNVASYVNAFRNLLVTGGNIISKTIFDVFVSEEKQGFGYSKKIHGIDVAESSFQSVTGNVAIIGKYIVDLEGGIYGSIGDSTLIKSVFGNVRLLTKTETAVNQISSTTYFPTISFTETEMSNTASSQPRINGGKGIKIEAFNGNVEGEGVIFTGQELEVDAINTSFIDHKVTNFVDVYGLSFGVEIPGYSAAANSIANNKSFGHTVKALATGNRGIASVCELAASKDGVDVVNKLVSAALEVFDNVAYYSKAYNNNKLQETLLESMKPSQVSVRVGSSSQSTIFTQSLPTEFRISKKVTIRAKENVLLEGCKTSPLEEGAKFIGKNVTLRSAREEFETSGSGMGLSLTFGNGIDVGVDYSENDARSQRKQNNVMDFGASIEVKATNHLLVDGLKIKANVVYVEAKTAEIITPLDTSSYSSTNVALSTSNVNFAHAHGHSHELGIKAGFEARGKGTMTIKDTLNLVSASNVNMQISAKTTKERELDSSKSNQSFSASLNVKEIKDSKPKSFSNLGSFDYKDNNTHLGATFISANKDEIQKDIKEIKQALTERPIKPAKALHLITPIPTQEVIPQVIEKKPPKEEGEKEEYELELNKFLDDLVRDIKLKREEEEQRTNSIDDEQARQKIAAEIITEINIKLAQWDKAKQDAGNKSLSVKRAKLLYDIHEFFSFKKAVSAKDNEKQAYDEFKRDLKDWDFESKNKELYDEIRFEQHAKENFLRRSIKIESGSYEEIERNEELDRINKNRIFAKVTTPINEALSAVFYNAIKSAEFTGKAVCYSHPSINKGCTHLSDKIVEVSKGVVGAIPESVKNLYRDLSEAMTIGKEKHIKYNQNVLGISEETTNQLYKDVNNNLLFASNAFLPQPKIKFVKGPKIEIISPNLAPRDLRGLNAKDVTPKPLSLSSPAKPKLTAHLPTKTKPKRVSSKPVQKPERISEILPPISKKTNVVHLEQYKKSSIPAVMVDFPTSLIPSKVIRVSEPNVMDIKSFKSKSLPLAPLGYPEIPTGSKMLGDFVIRVEERMKVKEVEIQKSNHKPINFQEFKRKHVISTDKKKVPQATPNSNIIDYKACKDKYIAKIFSQIEELVVYDFEEFVPVDIINFPTSPKKHPKKPAEIPPYGYFEPEKLVKASSLADNALIANRINSVADQRIYFPDISQMHSMPLNDLHAIWHNNNKTLIGLIDANEIPRFGLHGTDKAGIEGIQTTKKTEKLYLASYRYALDPITLLADFNTLLNKTWGYLDTYRNDLTSSGRFILNMDRAETTENYTTHHAIFGRPHDYFSSNYPKVPQDASSHEKFISFIERNPSMNHVSISDKGEIVVSTKGISNTYEYLHSLSPDNYQSRVQGLILTDHSLYNSKELKRLHTTESLKVRGIMAERFKNQESIIETFEKLFVVKKIPKMPWKAYQAKGESLLNNIDEVTKIPLKHLMMLNVHSENLNSINAKFRGVIFSSEIENNITKGISVFNEKLQKSYSEQFFEPKNTSLPKKQVGNDFIGKLENVKEFDGYISHDDQSMLLVIDSISKIDSFIPLNYLELSRKLLQIAQNANVGTLYLEVKKEHSKVIKYFEDAKVVLKGNYHKETAVELYFYLMEIPVPKQPNLSPKSWDHEKPLKISSRTVSTDKYLDSEGRLKRFTDKELSEKVLIVKDGYLYHTSSNTPLNSQEVMSYVMLKDGTIRTAFKRITETTQITPHNALVIEGEEVIAAGEIRFLNGKITYLNEKSGHYAPWDRVHYIENELILRGARFTSDYVKHTANDLHLK
jgi:hypothetical protein